MSQRDLEKARAICLTTKGKPSALFRAIAGFLDKQPEGIIPLAINIRHPADSQEELWQIDFIYEEIEEK